MKIKFDKTFDWFDVLERLVKGEELSYSDKYILMDRAGNWPTCACGQLCKALPRNKITKVPEDATLQMLGVKFAEYVNMRKWVQALHCFNKIEARSAELLGLKLVPRHKTEKKPYAVTMGGKQNERRLHATGSV